jgi:hypothetical protein
MSDFDDDLRRAVAGAAAGTVAPPFAAVERRARARRNRQAAAVAASVVAVLAGVALAVSGRGVPAVQPAGPATVSPTGASGWLKPANELHMDVQAQAEIGRCVEFRKTLPSTFPDKMKPSTDWIECHRQAGFEAPPFNGQVNVRTEPADHACAAMPATGAHGTRTIAGGVGPDRRWFVLAWDGMDGAKCVGLRIEPPDGAWVEKAVDTGRAGALRPVLSRDAVSEDEPLKPYLYWGAVPAEVVRVVLTAGGTELDGTPVLDGDRGYVAVYQQVPADDLATVELAAYDAQGRRVPVPLPGTD